MYNLNQELISGFERYLDRIEISKITSRFYKSDVRQFLHWIEKKHYQEINEQVVEDYIAYIRGKSTPARSVNRRLSSLRRLSAFMGVDFMKGVTNEQIEKQKQFPVNINRSVAVAGAFLIIVTVLNASPSEGFSLTNPLDTSNKVWSEQISSEVDLNTPRQIRKLESVNITIVLEDPKSASFESADRLPFVLSASTARPELTANRTYETSGEGVIYKNDINTKVVNPLISETSRVFVTPTSSTGNQTLFVAGQGEGYFVVELQRLTNADIRFNWIISN